MRRVEASVAAAIRDAQARLERETLAFHVERVTTTADLLGIPVEQVGRWDIIRCRMEYGVPASLDEAPKLRFDRRYGIRNPA
jgi:hypothetical protein